MTFLLAHLSDPHVPPLPLVRLSELTGKRMLGYLNWTRNRHAKHSRAVLDALVVDMQAHRPDHIAVTGDIVNLSLDLEYVPARKWVEAVGPSDRVTVIPGNHDAYVRGALLRFNNDFGDYMTGDAPASSIYPFVRRRGDVVLIGTSTAVATGPMMATGWLGETQLAALDKILATLAAQPVFRVLLIHHPLRSHERHKRLTDSAALLSVLKRRGVDLVLHGHDHVHSTIFVEGPSSRIPVVGVPSASAAMGNKRPPAAYNLFEIEKTESAWRCTHRTRGLDERGAFRELAKVELI